MSFTESGYAAYGLSAPDYRKVSSDKEGKQTSVDQSQALKITYDISDTLTFTSVTTHRKFNDRLKMDWDFGPYEILHSDKDGVYDKLSQELRLNSSSDQLDWLIGFYYDKDKTEENIIASSMDPSMANTVDKDVNGASYSAFGHLSYDMTDKISLVGGLRYEKADATLEDHPTGLNADDSWSAVSPKIAAEYCVNPTVMTYATIAKGYRSGGFNIYSLNPNYFTFDSETLWSYELGVKSTLNKRTILNGAVYYLNITDMQVSEAINALESYTTNAGKASATGGEVEISSRINDQFTLMAGYGYSAIKFDSYEDAFGDYSGKKVPFAPEYTYNIGAQYRHESGFYARGDVAGYGKTYFDKTNEYSRDPYQVVNAKVGYEINDLDVYLYAKNLLDEEYDSEGYYGGYYIIYSELREVGVQVTYRF